MNSIAIEESKNGQLIAEVYTALNSLDANKLGDFFSDDATLVSLNDSVSPTEGKPTIVEFFAGFYAQAKNVNFELICTPVAMGNMVTFKHIDHFEVDGVQRDDHYVSVVLIVDGRVKKWLGYMQDV